MPDCDIAERKKELRARMMQVRKDLGAEARARADAGITAQVVALSEWRRACLVLTYLSFGPEVETRGLIHAAWEAGKVVALPWCVPHTRTMRWFRVAPPDAQGHSGLDDLVRSHFGVDEPVPLDDHEVDPNGVPAVVLVPALAFDPSGYRLGYGGGFYDTFLAGFAGASVGLCREAQLASGEGGLRGLGVIDEHDLAVHAVATEKWVMRP